MNKQGKKLVSLFDTIEEMVLQKKTTIKEVEAQMKALVKEVARVSK